MLLNGVSRQLGEIRSQVFDLPFDVVAEGAVHRSGQVRDQRLGVALRRLGDQRGLALG